MTESDLAFIRAEIDQNKSKPLDRKSIIPLFNEYILRMCDIQNNFSTRLEASFETLESRLSKAETLLTLLEKRLERTELADGEEPTTTTPKIAEESETERQQPEVSSQMSPDIPVRADANDKPPNDKPPNDEPVHDKPMIEIREHPVYQKFFKMLRLGIPEQAVKIKMTTEGIDPALLSNPGKLVEAVKIADPSSSDDDSD